MDDRILQAMGELGFTRSDTRVYLSLLRSSPATGYEVAASSGVPRSAIYNVLRRLQALGLTQVLHGKPVRYVPLEPERLIRLLGSRFTKTLEDLGESLRTLARDGSQVTTWSIQGYRDVMDQAAQLIAGASRSVYLSVWCREAGLLEGNLRRAQEAGVEVVLFSFTDLPGGIGRTLCYGIPEKTLEQYWKHKLIVVVDQKQVLVGGAEETRENRGVWSTEFSLVEMAVSNLVLDILRFGERMGQDTTDVVNRLTIHHAPVNELLATARPASGRD